MKQRTISLIGWYGVLAIVTAYALVTLNLITTKNYWYPLLNLSGALGVIVEAWSKKDTQPAVLNAVWAMVAAIGIIKLLMN